MSVSLFQVEAYIWGYYTYLFYVIRHGPLKNVWAMRYEAKNKYFKKWAKITGNFKNVAKTAATHHQRYMCYHMASKEFPLSRVVVGPGKSAVVVSNIPIM